MFATFLLAATLSIEDYVKVVSISVPAFSPDGKRIVYVATHADLERSEYDADLWVIGADGSNDTQLTRNPANDNHPRWSPDGSQIAFLSERDGGRAAVYLMGANGGEPEKLTSEKSAINDFEWSPDGKTIAYITRDPTPSEREDVHVVGGDERPSQLYLLDVASRAAAPLTRGPSSYTNISWSPDGSSIALERNPPGVPDIEKSDIVVVSRDGDLRPLVERPGVDRTQRFSPDGRFVSFLSTGGRNDWLAEEQLYVVPSGGGTPRLVSGEYNRMPEGATWSSDSRSLWLNGPLNTTSQIFRVNADGSGFRQLSRVDGLITATAIDARTATATFSMQSLTSPPELFISSLDGFAPRQLTHHNDALQNRQLGETHVIRWKNPKDGLEIEGLLTLPVGYEAGKRYPLLTFVHGGPASRFDQGFVGYLGLLYPVQVFASRGFAVLRPNPRGTGGYGESFRAANRNDWGGMDWVDINAGIDKVIADGIADPDRLGLMGWSYGGFMAAWAEGHSDRLKAISIGAPVVDLLSFHGTTDIRAFVPNYFRGGTDLPLDLLRARSPLWNLRPTRAHVLIQHGEADERVPTSQGTMLYRRLQELGVDVTMVTYPRAPHVPREPKQQIDVMRRNVEFFTQYVLSP
jgi:dipeptidyl aminopeptidase/acylaminoacyl peptidase